MSDTHPVNHLAIGHLREAGWYIPLEALCGGNTAAQLMGHILQ